MAARVLYIAGVPASGKSCLIQQVRQKFDISEPVKYGKCRAVKNRDGTIYVLGVFDGSAFEGTDKLPMDVIDDAIAFIKELSKDNRDIAVLAEGDRLFNARFLNEVRATLLLIDANAEELEARHLIRGDNQSEQFKRRCRTKIENFARKYGISRVLNNDQRDAHKIFTRIKSFIQMNK